MRWFVVLLLAGCSAQTTERMLYGASQEDRAAALIAHYGPRCGATLQQAVEMPPAQQQKLVDCVKLHIAADRGRAPSTLDNLGWGLRGAGEVMNPYPVRSDLICMNNCTRQYSYGYCESRCSY